MGISKLKLRFAEKDEVFLKEKNVGVMYLFSWASCCETWLKFEVKGFRCSEKLKLKKCLGRGLPR